jgi:hypothetical protein
MIRGTRIAVWLAVFCVLTVAATTDRKAPA